MYVKHFGLTYKPFSAAPDPRFLWLGEDQKKQIASLRHALLTQSGFVLITGDVGTGKTVLAKWLAESITKAAIVVHIPDPDMEKLDFFNFIADGLGLEQYFESKADFLIGLKRRLAHADDHSRKIVLVIDEAHRLRQEMLQEIRLLANIDSGGRMQLSTVLAGLPGIGDMLRDDRNRNVLQRVSASIHLAPLTAESTRTYIIYRLRKAGAARGIFTGPALEQIYSCSRGNPRLINSLCDHALVTGYAADKETIDPEIVQESVNELNAILPPSPPDPGVEETTTVGHGETPEAEPIETLPVSSSFTSKRPSRLRYFSVALMTVILTFAAGYSLMSRFFELPADEADNEAAVTEIVQVLESRPEGQDSVFFPERLFGHEMGDESDGDDTAAGQVSADANDFDPTTIRKKIEVPAADTIESPGELNR